MNRKQWIYAAVLSVAATAFVVDRLFLGVPQEAAASPAVEPPRPSAAPAPLKTAPILDPSLSWLGKLADTDAGRDIFAPPPDWIVSQQKKAEAAQTQQQKGPLPGSSEAFLIAHQLQGTTVMSAGGVAVVDGRCLSVGDALEGFQLVRVAAGEAEFHNGAERAVLTLPMAPGQVSRQPPSVVPSTLPVDVSATRPAKSPGLLWRLFGGGSRPERP